MAMADYEPASGWNLPPGCFDIPDEGAYGDEEEEEDDGGE